MGEDDAVIVVEIVLASALRAVVKPMTLPKGANLGQAVLMAAEDPDLKEVDFSLAPLGVFGELAQRGRVLNDGDRIEIYRPLIEDPKTARRKRANRARRG